jgi:phosphate acetyltransferase
MKHAFFLAPSGTGVGLTTVSLGLFNALDSHGVPVAYFKPISQGTESTSGLDRSTHFIRTTTMLQPADPMPAKTANRMISEGRLDEFLGHVIAAFAMAALSKVPLAGLILTGDVAIDERISVGPMLQGLRRPVNDLSRGALVDDIVYTIALTAIQATQT